MQALYRFNIPTSFPVGAEASYQQISEVCGLSEPEVRRIVRYAMTKHIFKETSPGIVAHTAASQALAEVPNMRDWVGMVCEEMWPSAARVNGHLTIGIVEILISFAQTVDAMIKWPGSQEPNHTVKSSMISKDHELTRILRVLRSRTKRKTRLLKS